MFFMPNVTITVCDIDGKVIQEHKAHNMVVRSGRNIIRDLLNNSTTGLSHFAIGTSTTAVTSNQTILFNHVLTSTITQYVPSTSSLTVKYYLGTNDANGETLTEAGIFNSTATTADSLVHFDGTAGSMVTTDESRRTWTNFGAAMLSTAQFKFGTAALTLPGSVGSYVQTTDINNMGSSNWTLEGWFYINSTAATQTLIASIAGFGLILRYSNPTGAMELYLGNASTAFDIVFRATGTTLITSNAWHHWALTYNSSTYKAWIDGTQDIAVVSTILVNSVLNGLTLGNSTFFLSGPFNGYLDETRITKGNAVYTSSFTPSTAAFAFTLPESMYARVVHTGIPKSSATTVTYSWDLTWSAT